MLGWSIPFWLRQSDALDRKCDMVFGWSGRSWRSNLFGDLCRLAAVHPAFESLEYSTSRWQKAIFMSQMTGDVGGDQWYTRKASSCLHPCD